MAERTRNLVFPPLPDMDLESASDQLMAPAADGRPWLKACGECALRTSDPQQLGESYQQWIAKGVAGCVFYCIHRHDQGETRVCASYAALHPEQAIQEGEDR